MQNSNDRPATQSGTFTVGGDLNVHRLGYGAMRITGDGIWGPPKDKQESLAVLRRAIELGIDFIDTADSYGPNVSEELIAEALYPYPQGLVIATKGGKLRTGPNVWPNDISPKHLREALEGSLRRLRLDRIDLYQLHTGDPNNAGHTPIEDAIGELAKMKAEGKIRHVGVSNFTIDQLAQAQKIVPIVTVQNRYNPSKRESERMTPEQSDEMIDICARQGIGYIPWGPLAAGELARPGGPLDQIAKRHNAQPSQITIAWLLQRSPNIILIPGTSSVKHLEENVASASIKLTPEEFKAIDQGHF